MVIRKTGTHELPITIFLCGIMILPDGSIQEGATLDDVVIEINGTEANVSARINLNRRTMEFTSELYRNTLKRNAENSVFGVDRSLSLGYRLVTFSIEENADLFSLMGSNKHMVGETVVTLAFYSYSDMVTYAFQFVANELMIPSFITASEEMVVYELANFGGVSYQAVKDDMDLYYTVELDVEEVTFHAEEIISNSNNIELLRTETGEYLPSLECLEKIIFEPSAEDLLFDKYIEISRTHSIYVGSEVGENMIAPLTVVPGIPNSTFRRPCRTFGWTFAWGQWHSGVVTGFAVYHMPQLFSNNTLNYAARFRGVMNVNGQSFIISFQMTHNVWVQFLASTGRVYIFDDRPWNARLSLTPRVWMSTPNNQRGHFTHHAFSSISSASRLSRVMEAALIWIPHVSSGRETWTTLTAARRTTGHWHPTNPCKR